MRHEFTRFDVYERDYYVRNQGHRNGWYLYVGRANGRSYYRHSEGLFEKAHPMDAARLRGQGMHGVAAVTYDLPGSNFRVGSFAPDRDTDGYLQTLPKLPLTADDWDGDDEPSDLAEAHAALSNTLEDYKMQVREQIVADLSRTPSPEELRKVNGKLMALGLLPVEEPYKVVTVEVRVKVPNLATDQQARLSALRKIEDAVGVLGADKVVSVEAQGVERKGGQ